MLDFLFDGFGDSLSDFVRGLLAIISAIIGAPIAPNNDDPFQQFYNLFYTAALFYAIPVSAIVVILTMLFRHRLKSVLHAVVVVVVLSAINTSWVAFCSAVMTFGDQLADAVGFMQFDEDVQVPAFEDVIGAMFGTLTIGFWGSGIVLILVFYSFVNIIIMLTTPLFFALSPLGRRMQSIFEWLISVGIVSMILGRPLARLFVDISRFFMEFIAPDANWFIQCSFIAMGFGGAIALQVVLIKSVHRQVQGVMGRVTGTSTAKVKGDVNTKNDDKQKVDINTINQNHLQSINPVQQTTLKVKSQRVIQMGKQAAITKGKETAIKQLAAKAAASTTPVGRAIVMAHEIRETRRHRTRYAGAIEKARELELVDSIRRS